MSAFATTPVVTEKRPARGARQSDTIGSVYTRAFNIKFAAGALSGDTGAISLTLPSGTLILGAYYKCDSTNTNSTTVELKATTSPNAVFAAATAPVATGWVKAANTTPSVALLGVDDTVTVTLGTGNSPATPWTVSVMLVCAEIDFAASGQTTFAI